MRSPRSSRLARDESGITLIEMLLATALLAVVVSAILLPLESGARAQIRDASWADTLQSSRAGLDSMMRQLREAYSVLGTTANSVTFDVVLAGTPTQVLYECDVPQPGSSLHECTRVSSAVGGTLPAPSTGTVVVANLLNGTATDPVFGYSPNGFNPAYLSATAKLSAQGSLPSSAGALTHPYALDDGAHLPNNDLAQ